ncbi:MAG TPA: cation diffusion facilitator family transporter [Allosphingosinicella sp.]|jgi:ferrous-iron efflux pump FieF|nr:cation diffusion facilitator family transporter [Allosphingosinicella sp.]
MSGAAPDSRAALTTRAALASVATALFLLLLKGYAAWATGSVAMLGSLADTGLDVIASLVTLLGVRIAAMPADHDHRFGHGKAESLASLVQVGIIIVSALGIGWRAVDRLLQGAPTAHADYGIAVSAVAIAATLGLIRYQHSVIRRTGSVAIGTDRLHYQSDLLLNLSVILALALDQYAHLTGADALFGIAIAAWLLFGAWRASTQAVDQLMDKEWPEERRLRFVAVAARHSEGRGIHDLRTRSSGTHEFAQFHMWVDPAMSIARAHVVMDEIEDELAREFPGVEVLIHLDPEGQVDQPENPLAEADVTKGLPNA